MEKPCRSCLNGPSNKILMIVMIFTFLVHVDAFQRDRCGNVKQTFFSADNRALQTSTLREEQFKSAVRCVSYCHADNNCRSVNYHRPDQLCQMNNLTRLQNPNDFITHYGSVYIDNDADTSLFSVPQFRGCDEVLQAGHNVSGIYTIFPAGFNDGLQVYCDMETDGGGWIVIQRRQDGSVDFNRNWADYQVGFGGLSGEFWLGNDNLRSLTETEGKWQLRIDLEDRENNTAWAEYDDFQIHGDNYTLRVNSCNIYSTAGDSLTYHNGMMFSTKDKDNDTNRMKFCAKLREGAWWYKNCYESNLNGRFRPGTTRDVPEHCPAKPVYRCLGYLSLLLE
ncbi:microfibril-associated glycoprotein 4-like [Patiria miniata]|uniref:Fibrinogen C-terminal domain-containing protein n=1 Tax=Patiria miniata TaxID=46514 RepID=A0A914A4E0_PATMI|nr:microfibril-associated glycoprotein 4-like [Patiria miniata]